jgi:hypothetical protein
MHRVNQAFGGIQSLQPAVALLRESCYSEAKCNIANALSRGKKLHD